MPMAHMLEFLHQQKGQHNFVGSSIHGEAGSSEAGSSGSNSSVTDLCSHGEGSRTYANLLDFLYRKNSHISLNLQNQITPDPEEPESSESGSDSEDSSSESEEPDASDNIGCHHMTKQTK
jgi:hypothetical protein